MLPIANTSGAVQFVMKEELFIADDFQLKQAFTEASEKSLFAWFPPMHSSSQAKLLEIYASLGVRKISEAVQFDLHCTMSASKKIEKTDIPIGKALIKLVLAMQICQWKKNTRLQNLSWNFQSMALKKYQSSMPYSYLCRKGG